MIEKDSISQTQIEQFETPSFFMILKALLNKNFLILWANRWRYLLMYLSPLIVLLLIILLQNWAHSNILWQRLDTPIKQIPNIPHCYGDDCITIAYAINGKQQPYINHTMQYVKHKNNLTDQDIEKWDLNLEQVMSKLEIKPNKTQAVVVFCTDGQWNINGTKIPCSADNYHMNAYTIIFNLTLNHQTALLSNYKGAAPKDFVTVRLKKDIDEGIINFYGRSAQPETQITVTQFPSKNSRFISGVSIFGQYGSFFITIPYLILMVMEGSQRLKQKQDKLRIGLNIVGVSHFQFYLSQFLTYLFSVIILSTSFCIFGYALNFGVWSRGYILFDLFVLVVNGITLGIVSFCVVALVSNKNLGMSILYGFILYSIVMQWLFSGGFIVQFLYMDGASLTVKIIKFIFDLYPSFHFSKIFSDMVTITDTHFDTIQNRFVEGRDLLYKDLFSPKISDTHRKYLQPYSIPSAFQSSIYMCLNLLLYLFILFLLDRYIQSNRGYTEPICQTLTKKRKRSDYFSNISEKKPMVQITNLQKIYSNSIHALRGVSLELQRGQIVSLLGQNGAGKSTLINILIGALSLTKGQVIIDQKNISNSITQIRKIIGVCPQFDILWEQMTAQQHIKMFSRLKGLQNIDQIVKESLTSVKLYEFRQGRVNTFSGGMRRRLSLAISLIGNPKLVILDQPTTGMDPKIRQQTWKIVLSLRDRRRTMLITTHNMQQAECLSDRITIMNKGRIIIDGTSVQLKNKYGTGYQITGYKPDSEEQVKFKCKQEQLEEAMKRIRYQRLQKWSLKQTSLEQVFLNVVNKF